MKPKVIITVQEGLVKDVSCNMDMDVIIIDHDPETLNDPVIIKGPMEPDELFTDGSAYSMYIPEEDDINEYPEECKNVHDFLKKINF